MALRPPPILEKGATKTTTTASMGFRQCLEQAAATSPSVLPPKDHGHKNATLAMHAKSGLLFFPGGSTSLAWTVAAETMALGMVVPAGTYPGLDGAVVGLCSHRDRLLVWTSTSLFLFHVASKDAVILKASRSFRDDGWLSIGKAFLTTDGDDGCIVQGVTTAGKRVLRELFDDLAQCGVLRDGDGDIIDSDSCGGHLVVLLPDRIVLHDGSELALAQHKFTGIVYAAKDYTMLSSGNDLLVLEHEAKTLTDLADPTYARVPANQCNRYLVASALVGDGLKEDLLIIGSVYSPDLALCTPTSAYEIDSDELLAQLPMTTDTMEDQYPISLVVNVPGEHDDGSDIAPMVWILTDRGCLCAWHLVLPGKDARTLSLPDNLDILREKAEKHLAGIKAWSDKDQLEVEALPRTLVVAKEPSPASSSKKAIPKVDEAPTSNMRPSLKEEHPSARNETETVVEIIGRARGESVRSVVEEAMTAIPLGAYIETDTAEEVTIKADGFENNLTQAFADLYGGLQRDLQGNAARLQDLDTLSQELTRALAKLSISKLAYSADIQHLEEQLKTMNNLKLQCSLYLHALRDDALLDKSPKSTVKDGGNVARALETVRDDFQATQAYRRLKHGQPMPEPIRALYEHYFAQSIEDVKEAIGRDFARLPGCRWVPQPPIYEQAVRPSWLHRRLEEPRRLGPPRTAGSPPSSPRTPSSSLPDFSVTEEDLVAIKSFVMPRGQPEPMMPAQIEAVKPTPSTRVIAEKEPLVVPLRKPEDFVLSPTERPAVTPLSFTATTSTTPSSPLPASEVSMVSAARIPVPQEAQRSSSSSSVNISLGPLSFSPATMTVKENKSLFKVPPLATSTAPGAVDNSALSQSKPSSVPSSRPPPVSNPFASSRLPANSPFASVSTPPASAASPVFAAPVASPIFGVASVFGNNSNVNAGGNFGAISSDSASSSVNAGNVGSSTMTPAFGQTTAFGQSSAKPFGITAPTPTTAPVSFANAFTNAASSGVSFSSFAEGESRRNEQEGSKPTLPKSFTQFRA